ncbi:microcephalin isoform X2 [Puntigrus tetrazona]|uniref:microcephalin isoform X2 n=1 Tax=Puntigrus tetrazona TaxID=1606681 RepID=UPI001C89EC75|nr:microcephalin isoform X2 [Puntigrus tetrazona]
MTEKNASAGFLKDVVAYVDVWSVNRMEDYSDPFIQQLQNMGAEVSKTLNKQVTHVVFKHGRPSIWKKAQKMGVRIVSVHWVARCKESNERADESLFPAQNEESKLHLSKRTHRCMQPRDIPIKTPENDRRLKKKFDKMIKGLISSSPIVSDTSPFVIDEENGVVYSPSLKRSDSMAQRLREMRAQRECLSPTASQMLDSASGCNSPLRPPFGESPTLSFWQQLEQEPLDCFSTSLCHSSKKRDEEEKQNCNKKLTMKISSKARKQTPPESDTAMVICNVAGVETHSKVSPISSRSKRSLVNNIGGKKQSTLKSYIDKTCCEGKQSSRLKPQTENTGIYTKLSGNPERPECSLPESLTKNKHKNRKSIQQSSDLQTNSKPLYSKKTTSPGTSFTKMKSDGSVTHRPFCKPQLQTSAVLCSTDLVGGLPNRDVVECEVFEDYFSPANNALKRKVSLFGSTTEKLQVPTFDLDDSNKRKAKRSFGKKRKHKNIDIEDFLVGSSDPAPETPESRPECLSVGTCELPRFEGVKLEAPAKKQMRQTRLNSFVLSEEKKRKSSIDLGPAIEKKTSTATPQVSSSVVNVNLKIQNCLEIAPDPKHAIEKRPMGLKTVGKENGSTTDGSLEKSPKMSSKPRHMKKDKFMKKNRSLVMTSMPTEKQEIVFQLVRNLGGFTVVDNVCESTTHVVSGSPRRTLNILLGIARGCWILSFEWILWCLEHRQWVPEEPYELSDHFPAAPRAATEKRQLRMQLYNSSNATSAVPKSHHMTKCPDVCFAVLLPFYILFFKALVPLNV